VAELKEGEVRTYTLVPEDFGIARDSLTSLRVADIAESLTKIRQILAGQTGPAHDIVALNAGAAIYTAGLTNDLGKGVQKALAVMADGSAARVLEHLVSFSQRV
jgi:anthranilate phosphoribosyltransferase